MIRHHDREVRVRAASLTILALATAACGMTTIVPTLAGPGAAAPALVEEEYVEVAIHGLGDAQNSVAWSAAWWNDKLYVGTGRSVACVQSAALETAYPWIRAYPPSEPDVDCTPDPLDLPLRAEIWRWSPASDTWALLYRAPNDADVPGQPGRTTSRDIGYRSMLVFTEADGTEALYVAGVSARSHVPGTAPPRLLRSTDGLSFEPVPQDAGTFLGDTTAHGFRSLTALDGKLYLVASSGLLGHGAVYESADPAAGGDAFRQVTPPDLAVAEIEPFQGRLHVGTGADVADFSAPSFSVMAADPVGEPPYAFDTVLPAGAGRPGAQSKTVTSMHVWGERLWVGTDGPAELYRVNPDLSWDVVVGTPRWTASGTKSPLSGFDAGFDDDYNTRIWRVTDHSGWLVAGTVDSKTFYRTDPDLADLLTPRMGFDLYTTPDGRRFTIITQDGFGDPLDVGLGTLMSSDKGLVLGSSNHYDGFTVHVEGVKSFTSAPEAVEVDRTAGAPILTWIPAEGSVLFRVTRADATTLEFVEVGTTTEPYFVDPATLPGRSYEYVVLAEDAQGVLSAPSNVVRYPNVGAPVTFSSLYRSLGRWTGASALGGFASSGGWLALGGNYAAAAAELESLRAAAAAVLSGWQMEDLEAELARLERRLALAQLGFLGPWEIVF